MNVPQTGGGLRLTSRDLLKNRRTLPHAETGTEAVLSTRLGEAFNRTTRTDRRPDRVRVPLVAKVVQVGRKGLPCIFMSGNGGNKVAVFPVST